jgi:methylmalonyl-CoA mutase
MLMVDNAPPERPLPELAYPEFNPLDPETWRALAAQSNSDKPFYRLTTATYEGITLQPFYTAADIAGLSFPHTAPGFPPYVRGTTAAGYLTRRWAIAQELATPTPSAFNDALLDDLMQGQTAVNILLDAPTRAGLDPDQAEPGEVGRGGLSLATVSDVTVALSGVDPTRRPFTVRSGTAALPLLALFAAHIRRGGQPASNLQGWLESDPLGVLAHEGTLPLSLPHALDEMADTTRWSADHAPRLGTIAVHSYPYANAGANAVHELAFALATAVYYLRELAERGLDFATVAPQLRFDFAVGSAFFMEIAKLRASRLLWSQVAAAYGADLQTARLTLHARTGRLLKTLVDPHTNMLRVTTEALSAVLGGVDSLHVSPFDEPAGNPDAFSRRVARNVQLILQDEVHLTQLIDPAGGTWAVESLVNDLAQEAWSLFQEIEAQGGMWAALQSGFVHDQVAAVRTARHNNMATRKDVLIGANQFANPAEGTPPVDATDYDAVYRERVDQLTHYRSHDDDPSVHVAALDRLGDLRGVQRVEAAIAAAHLGATLNEITRALRPDDPDRPAITPLPQSRLSEPFEALRVAAAEFADGRPPRIFLATLGPLRQHKARADFAQAFFEVGGFDIVYPSGFATAEEAATAALDAAAQAVVICSTDDTYPDLVPPLAGAIKRATPGTAIILAGRPGDQEAAYRTAGVDHFIYLGADCLAINEWLLDHSRTGDPA